MKQALFNDGQQLVELMAEFYAEAGYKLNRCHAADAWATLLTDERLGYVWLIQSESKTIGYILLTLKYAMEYGGMMACVDDFFIRAPFRNRGLGTAALKEVRAFCADHQIRAVTVEVGRENGAAQTIYRRAGFVETDHQLLTLAIAEPIHAA